MSDLLAVEDERGGRGYPVDSALFALLALGLVLVLAPRTAPFTTDSDAYLDVADNLRAGRGLVQGVVDFWRPGVPEPLGMWPPLYPALVALLAGLGLPLEAAGRAVPALSFAVFAGAFHVLCARALGRGLGALVTVIALATPGVALLGARAWSEATYIALIAVGLVLASSPSPLGRGRALGAGLALALAALTRHAGLPLVAAAAVAVWFVPRFRGVRAPFLIALLGLPAAWLARNFALFGHPLGPALPAARAGVMVQGFELARALRWELLPAPFDRNLGLALVLGIPLLLGVVLALRVRGTGRWAAVLAILMFATVLVATSTSAINAPTGRYLAPALPFVVLAAIAGLAGREATRPGPGRSLVLGGTAVVALAAFTDLAGWIGAHPAPAPETAQRRSELSAIRALVPAGETPVLSDRGHAVRLATGRRAVQVPPAAFRGRDYDRGDDARWASAQVNVALWTGSETPPAGPWRWHGTAGNFTAWTRAKAADQRRPGE